MLKMSLVFDVVSRAIYRDGDKGVVVMVGSVAGVVVGCSYSVFLFHECHPRNTPSECLLANHTPSTENRFVRRYRVTTLCVETCLIATQKHRSVDTTRIETGRI